MEDYLEKLEGLNTLEAVAEKLGVKKTTALNILCRLKKAGYVKVMGVRGHPRDYKVTLTKQSLRSPGIYDILNKYNPDFQIVPNPDHQVHTTYTVEDAIVDAVKSKNFRKVLATLRLFNHVTNWKKLYQQAKQNNVWQQVGALYDTARAYMRVRSMPKRYRKGKFPEKVHIIRDYDTKEDKLQRASQFWNVGIPFRKGDLYDVLVRYYPVRR